MILTNDLSSASLHAHTVVAQPSSSSAVTQINCSLRGSASRFPLCGSNLRSKSETVFVDRALETATRRKESCGEGRRKAVVDGVGREWGRVPTVVRSSP